MLDNKKTRNQGVHYSRYIASWVNYGGSYFGEQFAAWLRANDVEEDEIRDIREMATCGKLELEMTAGKYIRKMNKLNEQIDNGEEPEEEP